MRIREFGVEIWMNAHENDATWDLPETCVDSITIGELLTLTGRNDDASATEDLRQGLALFGDWLAVR